jgi:hypothetical protein
VPALGLELGCHVFIQGERRSHAMMLASRHHDVKVINDGRRVSQWVSS